MNAGLIILRVASERRDAQNESVAAGAAQLRRSSDSIAAARVAQNTKHKKKTKKTKQIKRTTRSPESVVFVFSFSRPPVFWR